MTSPNAYFPSLFSSFPVTFLFTSIIAVSTGSDGLPFDKATLEIVPVAFSSTLTTNETVFDSPAFKSTFQMIPFTTPSSSTVVPLSVAD